MLVVYDPFLSAVRKAAGKTELFPLVILLVLTAVSGLRYDVGVDYPVYREVYDSPSDIRALAFEPFWIFFFRVASRYGFCLSYVVHSDLCGD